MNVQVRVGLSTLTGLTIGLMSMITSPLSRAATEDFWCGQQQQVWTTFVRTSRGLSPLIKWTNDKIQGWPPRKRCVEVSKRMQRLSDNGSLDYLVGGVVNDFPVLCGVRLIGDYCTNENLVLTLPLGLPPDDAVDKLLNVTARARGQVLEISGSEGLRNEVNGFTYINMELLKEIVAHEAYN